MTEISPHVTHPIIRKSYQAAMANIPPMGASNVIPQEKFKSTKLDSLPTTVASTLDQSVHEWQVEDVVNWAAKTPYCSLQLMECLRNEQVDGQVLLVLTEEDLRDMRYKLRYNLTFGELKKFWLSVVKLQLKEKQLCPPILIGLSGQPNQTACTTTYVPSPTLCPCPLDCPNYVNDCDAYINATRKTVPPEYLKTAISLGYSFVVTWITSFVMVIVHERVPDMKRYPPLPDIFLDNVPHIPWAFNMCEITGTLLFSIWMVVIVFHKYRTVLLRRFFALAGTVFLLRCVTMLITSLSVPGTHLQCNQKDFAIEDPDLDLFSALWIRMRRAYTIWSGLGMSIQGVRTCGDYMFSGHTVALTLLNFFITEYTPRNLYFLHTLTWLLNMFGIFFILAAHEHYSIDVFVAFYITSRLFLYYHTLANNQALMQSDSTRTRIWFPMFSYFESSVEGIIPNVYDSFATIIDNILHPLTFLKDGIMLTAYRIWVDPPKLRNSSKHLPNGSPLSAKELNQQNSTSTTMFSISSPHASGSTPCGHRHQTAQSLPCQEERNLRKNEVVASSQTATPKSVGTATSFDTEIKDFKTKKQT